MYPEFKKKQHNYQKETETDDEWQKHRAKWTQRLKRKKQN